MSTALKSWDSIAKAEYIARVSNEYTVEFIAKTIADRHDTVKRPYRGLMVLEQAEQEGVFDRDDRWNAGFAYSHLWTGLGYAGIQGFLGLGPDEGFKPNPVQKKHLKDLGDLLLWMYGSKDRNQRPLIQSQNPDLETWTKSCAMITRAAIRAGLPLEIALKASRGDERLLREALVKAEVALREANGLIPTAFKKQSDLFAIAGRIARLAESVYDRMSQTVAETGEARRRAHRGRPNDQIR